MRAIVICALLVTASLTVANAAGTATSAADVLAKARLASGISRTIPRWKMVGSLTQDQERGAAVIWTDAATGAASEFDSGPRDIAGAEGFDGAQAWIASADGVQRESTGLPRGVLAAKADVLSGAILLPTFAKYATLLGTSRGSSVVRFSPPGIQFFDVWFSQATYLPERAIFYGEDTHVYRFDDYRTVGGFAVPFSIREDDAVIALSSVTETHRDAAVQVPSVLPTDFGIEAAYRTEVPINFDGNHVLVGVNLNGHGPFNFILDSGGHNIMSNEVARALGLTGTRPSTSGGIGSGVVHVTFAAIRRVSVGSAYIKNQMFKIMDIKNGFGESFGQRIDGVIGFQLLARFRVTIDYANHTLILATTHKPLPHAIPFTFLGDMPAVQASLGAQRVWFGIDTGDGGSMTLFKSFWRVQFPPSTKSFYGPLGVGVGGSQNAWFAPVTSFRWAGFALPKIIVDFADANKGDLATRSAAGNIGGRLLRRFTVTFDYQSQTLDLVPNRNFAAPDTFNRSGLVLSRYGRNIKVLGVLTGSPAYADGVRAEDLLVSVNGTPSGQLSLLRVKNILQGPAGKIVSLSVSHGGDLRSHRLVLADYI